MCRMRNWKVKNKLLFGFGILIVLMVAMSLLAGLGLKSIHDENNSLVHRVIPNTERVWELRRNLMSEQRYELMAFAESNPIIFGLMDAEQVPPGKICASCPDVRNVAIWISAGLVHFPGSVHAF